MTYEVRRATLADAPAVLRLEKDTFPDPWSEGAILSHMEGTTALSFVAVSEGAVCGYLLGTAIPPEGELYRVAVSPGVQRKGVGYALLSAFHDALSASGVSDVFLEVRESNASARQLYRRLGYLPIDTRKNYYKSPTENAVVYRLMLKKD